MTYADGYPEFLSNQRGQFDHPKVRQLLKVLRGYSLEKTLPIAAGLCAVPRFQANIYRLELFVQAVVTGCNGKKTPTWQQFQTWLNFFVGDSEISRLEDPPEDAFVLNWSCPNSPDTLTFLNKAIDFNDTGIQFFTTQAPFKFVG